MTDFDASALLAEWLATRELSEYGDMLLAVARPTVLLRVEPSDVVSVGASKLGGTPELPQGWQWPVARECGLMTFLAQVDLASVPAVGQPLATRASSRRVRWARQNGVVWTLPAQ